MARQRNYSGEGGYDPKKVRSLMDALQGESIREHGRPTRSYGGKAGFWSRLVVYGGVIAVCSTALIYAGSLVGNLDQKRAENLFKMRNGIESTVELNETQQVLFRQELGVEDGEEITNDHYSAYSKKK